LTIKWIHRPLRHPQADADWFGHDRCRLDRRRPDRHQRVSALHLVWRHRGARLRHCVCRRRRQRYSLVSGSEGARSGHHRRGLRRRLGADADSDFAYHSVIRLGRGDGDLGRNPKRGHLPARALSSRSGARLAAPRVEADFRQSRRADLHRLHLEPDAAHAGVLAALFHPLPDLVRRPDDARQSFGDRAFASCRGHDNSRPLDRGFCRNCKTASPAQLRGSYGESLRTESAARTLC
jgi:hypothetical protein